MSTNFGRPENPSECMGKAEEITKHQMGSEIRKPLSEGIYVRGSLNDLPVLFTADTGGISHHYIFKGVHQIRPNAAACPTG